MNLRAAHSFSFPGVLPKPATNLSASSKALLWQVYWISAEQVHLCVALTVAAFWGVQLDVTPVMNMTLSVEGCGDDGNCD